MSIAAAVGFGRGMVALCSFALAFGFAAAAFGQGPPALPYEVTPGIELVGRVPWDHGQVRRDRVTAELFLPRGLLPGTRAPGLVITPSSGGIAPHVEVFWADRMAREGVVVLIVDSFTPRGIRNTIEDQSQLPISLSVGDAIAGLRWLKADPRVDPERIAILGMSKGGIVAMRTAYVEELRRQDAGHDRFAVHLAITPGCATQYEDAATTGAPLVFLLAEQDDYTPVAPCLELAERTRMAGGHVRLAVYPGVFHSMEGVGGTYRVNAEGWRCSFFQRDAATWVDRETGRVLHFPEIDAFAREKCRMPGTSVTVGGDARVKEQLTADVIQILRDQGFLLDREALLAVGSCDGMDNEAVRICLRARAGWVGDMVGLARVLRDGRGAERDLARAERLLRLAAARDNPVAKWELAASIRRGLTTSSDRSSAVRLAREAAIAGEAASMNLLGEMLADGYAGAPDDREALLWFERAAALRNAFAMANLGTFHRDGRAGLSVDPAAAIALFERSVFLRNPWGAFNLALALETGRGVTPDRSRAIAFYRMAADGGGDTRYARQAREAITRLSQSPQGDRSK